MGQASTLGLRMRFYDAELATRTIRLLVAEDDPEMRRLLCDRLRLDGFAVLEAKDGQQLLDYINTHVLHPTCDDQAVDLVISDVRMPGRTGLDVLADLRREDGAVPFIVITAFGDRETYGEARRLGAAAVFDKPFELDDLCTAVINLVAP
jgi:DNA-binding response OmpR family regulator